MLWVYFMGHVQHYRDCNRHLCMLKAWYLVQPHHRSHVRTIVYVVRYPWASCQIHKIAGCACTGIAGTFSPPPTSKETVSYRSRQASRMCVTQVPWCMSESLSCSGGENAPGIPGACATGNFAYLSRCPFFGHIILKTSSIWRLK